MLLTQVIPQVNPQVVHARPRSRAAWTLLSVVALCFGFAGLSRAATLVVTTVADGGAGSLRAALATSRADGDGDVITFDPAVFAVRQTIPVTSGILFAYAGVTIQGPTAGIILDGSAVPAGSGQPTLVFESDTATSFASNLILQNDPAGSGLQNRFGTLTLTNCTMQGNTAQNGGGVFNDGTLTMVNCTVANNATSQGGAGIFTYGPVTLTGCTISGNVSNNYGGGGIYNGNGGVHLTLTNCTVTNNVSGSDGGGGISNVGGFLTATNCTFTGNQATTNDGVYGGGGAIAILRGTTTLTNDILYGDTSPQGGGAEIFFNNNGGGGTLTANFCDIGLDSYGPAGVGDISADPLFVSAATGDLHLQPGSPALGAGTAAGAPAADKDGSARPTPPSIGAYDAGDLVLLSFPPTVPGGTVVSATVTLSGPAPTATLVGLSSSSPTVVRLFRSVLIPAGSSSATFPINTFRSHGTQAVTIRASLGPAVQAQTLTITGR